MISSRSGKFGLNIAQLSAGFQFREFTVTTDAVNYVEAIPAVNNRYSVMIGTDSKDVTYLTTLFNAPIGQGIRIDGSTYVILKYNDLGPLIQSLWYVSPTALPVIVTIFDVTMP